MQRKKSHPNASQRAAVRVHVGLAPKLDLCHTGSVLAPLGRALVKTEKVATYSDGPISYLVSKMLRNQHFASAKFSFQANLLGIDHDSTDETLGTSFLMELRAFRHD